MDYGNRNNLARTKTASLQGVEAGQCAELRKRKENEIDSIDCDKTDVGHTTNQTDRDISLQITHSKNQKNSKPGTAL